MKKARGRIERCVIAVLSCLALCLSGCSSPPVRSERVYNADEYLEVNGYVRQQLSEVFFALFPDEIPESVSQKSYCYEYECAIFGDPNFIISLKTAFEVKDCYEEEKVRAAQLNPAFIIDKENTEYVVFLGAKEDLEAYLDDEVRDGQNFIFCFSILDDKTQTLEYIYADVYDGSGLWKKMKDILMPLI